MDSKEKNLLRRLKKVLDEDVVVSKSLEVGDVAFANIIIERKTLDDFINSLISNRLWFQINNMVGNDGIEPILVVELKRGFYFSKISEQSVYAALRSIHKKGVWTTFTLGLMGTALFVKILYEEKKNKCKYSNFALRVKRKGLNGDEWKEFILEGFPGIGGKTAKEMLKVGGSLERIFTNPEVVRGVMRKPAYKKFVELLREEYGVKRKV